MIYHIPRGTTIHRTQSASSNAVMEVIVTDKEVYYTDKDLVRVEYNPMSKWHPGWNSQMIIEQPVYIFLLPISAKPWWSFRVYEDAIHRIHFIGMNTEGAQSEKELLQDLKFGKIDPFKTTPESQATDSTATAEEKIIGRPLTEDERGKLQDQWIDEAEEVKVSFDAVKDADYILEMKKKIACATGIPQRFMSNPGGSNWAKDAWLRPLLRPMFPKLPKDLSPEQPKPDDPAEAIAWAIDLEIMGELINGLWGLKEPDTAAVFYMDYKYSKGK